MSAFAHLQVASSHSLRYGAATPAALVQRAAELGQPAIALTDRDGLYGAVQWSLACQEAGIRPVLGVDLAFEPTVNLDRPPARGRRTPARGGAWIQESAPRVLLLASGAQGWASLCRLVSAAHAHGGSPLLPWSALAEHHAGIVALLGPQSELGRLMAADRAYRCDAVLRPWRAIFGRRLGIAIASHRMPREHRHSTVAAARTLAWARGQRVPVVLTNAVRYLHAEDARIAEILDASRLLVPLSSKQVERDSGEGYLKSAEQMAQIADEVCRAAGERDGRRLLADTLRLAEFCALDPQEALGIGEVFVPELDVLLGRPGATPAEADRLLRERCEGALAGRYADGGAAAQRLAAELRTIAHLGFAGYFLTVAEVVDLVRARGIRVAARGSGAGSLVNHLLGISGVDPMRHGLLMERFLSPLRRALPDIDIDVESARRLEVYDLIYERFGRERVACVSMAETYRVRHAIRDVGAALGMPAGEIDSFAKAFPHIRARNARSALEDLPELRRSELGRMAARGELDGFLSMVEALDGLPRNIALHPCGVLLSDTTLLDRTPIEPSAAGYPMSQFDKHDVETMGLLKLDVLGIRMQSAMAHAIEQVAISTGESIDLDAVPMDDQQTFELIRSTRTLGCFQIESPGQRELIGKFAPETFNDLIIDISLFRPGPVKSDMVTPFLRARQGWNAPEFLHPDLRPALAETCGVVVFHEQVLRIVATMTGCSLAEADETRRAMGSPEGQDDVRAWFTPAAVRRGYPLPVVERVWEVLRAFASFGFCKAHAAAFALPTYQSAWLKTHHPAAFYAGVLTHDPGMYPRRLILDDARNHGVPVLGIDVNASGAEYRVERCGQAWGVRMPFAQVKGIAGEEVDALVRGQPYSSLADLWHRARVSRPVAEHLVLAGAFDAVYGLQRASPVRERGSITRRDLLLQIADLDRMKGPCADQLTIGLAEPPASSGLPEFSTAELVRAELEILGMDVRCHVLDFYAPLLEALGVTRSRDLLSCRSQQEVLVAGVKAAVQTPPVRSGRRVVFVTLDDSTGPVDATFFEDAQHEYAGTVFHSWLLLVRGKVRRTGPRGLSLLGTGCWELGEVRGHWLEHGTAATLAMLEEDQPAEDAPRPRRVLLHASGFRQSPYADVRPAGSTAPAKLWHSSPGSSGW